MPSEEQIRAAADAIAREMRPEELTAFARAALQAAADCAADAPALAAMRGRALQAIAEHRCTVSLGNTLCAPRDGRCRSGTGGCIADAEHILIALEARGLRVEAAP